MKILTLLISYLICAKSFAAHPLEITSTDDETVSQKIKHLYAKGTKLDRDIALNKVGSGRCFNYKYQNIPLATVFTISKYLNDVGPIQDPVVEYKAILRISDEIPADYFDSESVTLSDEYIPEVRLKMSEPDDRTYRIDYLWGEAVSIRYSNPYIVVETYDNRGRVDFYCYYFNFH